MMIMMMMMMMMMIVSGETWEYWEPGEYRNSDDKTFTCLALNTDGLKIYLSQVKNIFISENLKYILMISGFWIWM